MGSCHRLQTKTFAISCQPALLREMINHIEQTHLSLVGPPLWSYHITCEKVHENDNIYRRGKTEFRGWIMWFNLPWRRLYGGWRWNPLLNLRIPWGRIWLGDHIRGKDVEETEADATWCKQLDTRHGVELSPLDQSAHKSKVGKTYADLGLKGKTQNGCFETESSISEALLHGWNLEGSLFRTGSQARLLLALVF